MQSKYRVDTFKAVVSMATVIFCFLMGISLIIISRYGSAAVFFLIGLIFLKPLYTYGATISIDQQGIVCRFLSKTIKRFTWDEIAEVGVAGTRIFSKKDSNRTGTLYIYLSKSAMTDEDRFQMMLKWPPKDKIFLVYSRKRLESVQMHFSSKIQTYNAGTLHI